MLVNHGPGFRDIMTAGWDNSIRDEMLLSLTTQHLIQFFLVQMKLHRLRFR